MKLSVQKFIKTVLLLALYCSLHTVFAQAPEKMSYQAVIRNVSNALITSQAVGMRVSILQGSASGSEVYKELFNPNPQTNSNGLVTIEIGTGLPITGTFTAIDWANGPYFIKTETDPTGGTSYTIVGTSQLMSVPYALYAKSSGNTAWGLSGNAGTTGTNFIGTTDGQDIIFKRNNINAGKISATNTSIGNNSFTSNTTGAGNSAFGTNTMKFNTTGDNNSAFGINALYANTTGSNNTASGYQALVYNTTGFQNIATGYNTLYSNTTGYNNTATGNEALYSNKTGYSNTASGFQALGYNTTGKENTANGQGALYSNTTGNFNTAVGNISLQDNIIGNGNTAIGYYALIGSLGSNNIGIGYSATVPSTAASNQVRIGNTSITYAGVQVAWTVTSDRRWKENIQPSNLGLNFIKDLKPVFYTRKNDETKKIEYGIIAQELEESLVKFGANTNGIINKDDKGMYSVRYNDLFAPIIKAIQEQQAIIEGLKAEIQILKKNK